MKAVKFIFGASMVGGHDSLIKQAKKVGVELTQLKTNEACVFINRAKDKLKAYSYNKVLTYIRFIPEDNRRIDMSALCEIAKAFNSRGILDYDKALKASLLQRFAARRNPKAELEVL